MKLVFKGMLFFSAIALCNVAKSQHKLIGQWLFDEGAGTVITDSSGNHNDALLSNAQWTNGVSGYGINFNATNSSITFPQQLSNDSFQANGTLAFWMKGDFSAQNQLSILDGWRYGDHLFIRTYSNNQIQFIFQESNSNYANLYIMTVEANVWTHIAVCWDTKNYMVSIYENGVAVYSKAIVQNVFNGDADPLAANWQPRNQNFVLGSSGPYPSFQGSLDDLRLYNYPLSASEINQVYNGKSISVSDMLSPSPPTILQGNGMSPSIINLSWRASIDSGFAGLAGYVIQRNGAPVHLVPANVTGFSDINLQPNISYQYQVSAFDYNGNTSSPTNRVSATTISNIFLKSDFESDTAQPSAQIFGWKQEGLKDSSITVTTEKNRFGNKGVRFDFDKTEWSNGNPEWSTAPPNLRSEITANFPGPGPSNMTQREVWWYGFSEFIPADWVDDTLANEEIIWQCHGASGGPSAGSPPLAAYVRGSNIDIQTQVGLQPTVNGNGTVIGTIPIAKGIWSDWVVRVSFDYTNGTIKVWRDGILVADYTGQNLYKTTTQTNENGPYVKFGDYKWCWECTDSKVNHRTLFIDEVRFGSQVGYSDVKPTGANDSGFVDITPPVITLNGSSYMEINERDAFTDPGAAAIDAVDGIKSVTVTGSVNNSVPGVYTLTYTATDLAQNTGTATRTIKVKDITPPVITLNGGSAINTPHGSSFTDPGATATDAVDGNVPVTKTGSVNTSLVGTYTLTYTAVDAAGNTATATRQVTVVDMTPPVITLNGSATTTTPHGSPYSDPGATANDAVDGVVNVLVSGTVNTNVLGTYTLTYTAKDKAGNTATKTRNVTVVDATPPVITLNGSSPMTVAQGSTFTDPGATATDAVDGSVAVTKSGTVNTSIIGDYTLTYTAKDKAGNTATKTRTVQVRDLTAPVISSVKVTVTTNVATITWTTNENATSQVKYGLTTSHGSQTAVTDASGVKSHTVTITNLAKCTTYNFIVVSADLAGNVASSTNSTFKTACR